MTRTRMNHIISDGLVMMSLNFERNFNEFWHQTATMPLRITYIANRQTAEVSAQLKSRFCNCADKTAPDEELLHNIPV